MPHVCRLADFSTVSNLICAQVLGRRRTRTRVPMHNNSTNINTKQTLHPSARTSITYRRFDQRWCASNDSLRSAPPTTCVTNCAEKRDTQRSEQCEHVAQHSLFFLTVGMTITTSFSAQPPSFTLQNTKHRRVPQPLSMFFPNHT
jgi:hypothetical protein